jgi:hypothetical protein
VIISKGDKMYHQVTDDHLPKDHKARLKTHAKSFTGREFVKWLQLRKEVRKEEEGVILGQALLENGVIHHGEEWVGWGKGLSLSRHYLRMGLFMVRSSWGGRGYFWRGDRMEGDVHCQSWLGEGEGRQLRVK